MKKSNKRLVEIMIVVFISTFIGMLGGAATIYTIDYNNKKENNIDVSKIDEIDSVFDKIVDDYYDNVDKNKLIEGAISGMLSVLDEHTAYIDKSATTSFNNRMRGEYYGIGVEALTLEGTGVLVVEVTSGSPAERSGIKPDDIIIYAVVISFIVFLNNIISYIYVKRKIKFTFKNLRILQYIKPLFLVLVLTNVEILYGQLDRIMLGKFVSDVAVTEYYIPYYLISMLASIPYAVINVSIPRLSYIVKTEGLESYKRTLKTSISSLLFIIVPMCFGVAVLSKEVVFLYAGNKYQNISNTLILACIIRIIISIESVLTNLVLYVNDKEKTIVKLSFLYGIANLIMNILLIVFNVLTPFNAMLTTGIAEIALITTQYLYIKRKMNITVPLLTKQNITYFILSLCFIPISYIVKAINFGFYANIIVVMALCVLLYAGILLIKKDESLYIVLNKFKNKLKLRGKNE